MSSGMMALRLSYRDVMLKRPDGKPLPELEVIVNGIVSCRLQHHATTGLCLQKNDQLQFRLKLAGKVYGAHLKALAIPAMGKRQSFEWINLEEIKDETDFSRQQVTGYPKLLVQLTRLGRGRHKQESYETIGTVKFGADSQSIIDRLESFERKMQEEPVSNRRNHDDWYERQELFKPSEDPFELEQPYFAAKLAPTPRAIQFEHQFEPHQYQEKKNSVLRRIFDTFENPEFAQQGSRDNSSTFTLY